MNHLNEARKKIQRFSFLSYICVSDCMLRSKDAVSEVKLQEDRMTFTEAQLDKMVLESHTRSFDGKFYICHSCKTTIKRGGCPRLNHKKVGFSVSTLPQHLKTEEMKLNRCENHLLKLNLPFIRIAHCPRSADFKVLGPMICVEARVEETMDELLPLTQQLIPVAIKRKMEYSGSYVAEIVDKEKVKQYYEYFKLKNHLFKDEELSDEMVDEFFRVNLESIEKQDEQKVGVTEIPVNDSEESADDTFEDEEVLPEAKEQQIDENLPSYLSEIPMDTLICSNIGEREGRGTLIELVASTIVEKDKVGKSKEMSDSELAREDSGSDEESSDDQNDEPSNQPPEVKGVQIRSFAPGEGMKFVNFESVEYVEERCFPHLFPEGRTFIRVVCTSHV